VRILQDLRYSPAFAATAILTLALGMGATTAMYSVIQAVLLNALPFPNAKKLLVFRESEKGGPMSVAWPNFEDMRAQQHSFEGLAAFQLKHFEYFDGSHTTLPRAAEVTAEFFPLLGAKAAMGRVFNQTEDRPGAPAVVVLGHRFWQNELHADPNIVGRSLTLSGKLYTVIGVTIPQFQFFFGRPEDFYIPLGPEATDPDFNSRTAHGNLNILARPKPGITDAAARAELEGIAARLAAEFPATNGGHSIVMYRLVENYFAQIRPVLWLLMAAVAIVLLVGCANVSNLLLTRGADREREFAIRSALGASGYRIFQHSMGESFLLAIFAGACGVGIAYLSLPFLLRFGPQNIPRISEAAIRWPVLAFAFAVTLGVSLVCGALPCWATLHVAPEQALRSHSTSSYAGRGKQRVRSYLLVMGVAVTLVLSATTGLLVQSLRRTLAVDPGFRPDHLLSLDIVLTGEKYKSAETDQAFFSTAEDKLRALPGVLGVGSVCTPPLEGECGDYFYSIPGKMDPNAASLPDASFNFADESYFRVAGIRLVSGRAFLPTDNLSSPRVAIVNQTFAHKWWPQGEAVGHTVLWGGRGEKHDLLQIVGIVEDTKQSGLDAEVDPEIFFPEKQQHAAAMELMVRTAGDPENMAAAAENAIHGIDREVPVRIHPMSYFIAQSLRQRQFLTLLLSIFAGLAIFLAALGIFGVAAYAVASRRPEIAVRIALGAQPDSVKQWISLQIVRRVGIGCAIGFSGSLLSARVVRNLLFGVSATSPMVLGSTCALLLVVAFLATWIPARRAASVDPMQALRAE
jgi:putative ABC transport system permease protein